MDLPGPCVRPDAVGRQITSTEAGAEGSIPSRPFLYPMAHVSRLRRRRRNEEEFDHGVRQWWQSAFEQAKHEREQREKVLAKDAYDHKDKKSPVGNLVAEVDMAEYLWCQEQYGSECWKDPDFINFYRKARDQNFLPGLSKSA